MKNNNFQRKHVRGSSSLPTDISESQSENWARGHQPIWANPKKSQRENQGKKLTSHDHGIGSPSEDERWQDDGGESGEVV